MFQGFEYKGLVNLLENNNPPQVMQRIFNQDANCYDWPFYYDNGEDTKKFYFTDENDSLLYEFEIPKGYRDFVVFRFDIYDDSNLDEPIRAKYFKEFNAVSFYGSDKKLFKKPLSNEALEAKKLVLSMYGRAFPQGRYYYCNPAYNTFEEQGIDMSQYTEIGNKDEGIFQLKGSKAYPNSERLEYDYHDNAIIYRYQKIEPKIIPKSNYLITEKSILEFTCNTIKEVAK